MEKYTFLAARYYKFFKYLRFIGIMSLIIFLGVTAFNQGNPTLAIISYVFMMISLVCFVECTILYGLYFIFRKKGK